MESSGDHSVTASNTIMVEKSTLSLGYLYLTFLFSSTPAPRRWGESFKYWYQLNPSREHWYPIHCRALMLSPMTTTDSTTSTTFLIVPRTFYTHKHSLKL